MIVELALKVLIVVVLVLIAYLVAIQLVGVMRTHRRALHDYRTARGTQHLKQVEGPLAALRHDRGTHQARIRGYEESIEALQDERRKKLERALVDDLVKTRLTEVPGIGRTLSSRIQTSVYRGSLRDLDTAYRVQGIGPATQSALSTWARKQESELPHLLKGTFPGKEEIHAEYASKEKGFRDDLAAERRALDEANALHDVAHPAIEGLRKVKPRDFYQALARNSPASRVPASYLEGLYPPWEMPPEWLERLLDKYGDRGKQG